MKNALLATLLVAVSIRLALGDEVGIHYPSTTVQCSGKLYTFDTASSSLISDDRWMWRPGPVLPRRGLTPDATHIGDRHHLNIADNIGGQPKAAVNMIWGRTLDPDGRSCVPLLSTAGAPPISAPASPVPAANLSRTSP